MWGNCHKTAGGCDETVVQTAGGCEETVVNHLQDVIEAVGKELEKAVFQYC
jgi:hypothetical protein